MARLSKILPILLFTFLPITTLFSYQLSDSLKTDSSPNIYVNRIIISGNKTTKDVVILREMKTREGTPLDVKTLEEDVERINNLGLFGKIEVASVPIASDSLNLIIDVEEVFYIIPIPQGGFKEGDLNKIWGGLNVKWRNFRGMNETLGLSFGIGYEPFINASYSNPWIGSDKYFMSTNVGYAQRYIQDIYTLPPGTVIDKNDIERYSSQWYNFYVSVGKHITHDLSISVAGAYNRISIAEYQPGRTLSPNGIDDYPTAILNAHLDSRDLFSYPSNGAYGNIDLIKYGFANKYINFNRVSLDFRKYVPIIPFKDYTIIFATRVLNSLAWGGNVPPYLKEEFGYGKVIRGWGEKVFEGDDLLGFFAEFRFPVIKPGYIKGKDIPIVKGISFLKDLSYKYGLYFTTFYDVGGVWNKDEDFSKTQFRNGYGFGLNLILPFNFVGRADIGFSKKTPDKISIDLDLDLNASF